MKQTTRDLPGFPAGQRAGEKAGMDKSLLESLSGKTLQASELQARALRGPAGSSGSALCDVLLCDDSFLSAEKIARDSNGRER